MTPSATTSLSPSSAEDVSAGPTKFRPSTIWCDVGGTVTVIPADGDGTTTVSFVVGNSSCVPVLCIAVTAVSGASGMKRLY